MIAIFLQLLWLIRSDLHDRAHKWELQPLGDAAREVGHKSP